MSIEDILSTAVERGVTFLLDGEGLAYRAPKGAMTQELRDAVAAHKQELVAALQRARATPPPAAIPRSDAPESEPAPLSAGQERLWLIDRLVGPSPLYNVHVRVPWSGPLDRAALEQGLASVVRRHASLRTTFRDVDGEPRAFVAPVDAPAARPAIAYLDVRDLVAGVKARAAERFAREQRAAAFDLERGPLVRVGVVTLADDDHVILLTQHHIVTDGWSVGLLLSELGEELRGAPPPRAPALRYADYARWQAGRRARAGWGESIAWWRGRLQGLPRLDLPYARAARPAHDFAGDAYSFALTSDVTERLRDVARARRCTLYAVLLTAWAALLHRVSGDETFALATVSSGRDADELRDVVGFFVNTLAVRCDLSGDPTVAEAIDRTRAELDEAFAREVPFGDVVAAVGGPRGASLNPLVQACLVFESAPAPRGASVAASVALDKLNASVEGTAKFDLNLILKEEPNGLAACLEYATSLFAPETIERMIGHFCALLGDMAARPSARVSELSLVGDAERAQALAGSGAPSVAVSEACFHELFEAQVARAPDAPALVTARERLTFRELDERANRVAHHLLAAGVRGDSLVGLWLPDRSAAAIVGMLGIAKAGGAYVPLDPKQPAARNRELVASAGVRVLVTDPGLAGEQAGLDVARVRLASDGSLREDEPSCASPRSEVRPSNLAYVIFTSGSTGKPKGVGVEHRNLAHYVAAVASRMKLPAGARYAHVSSFAADLGHTVLFTSLCSGGRLHFLDQKLVMDPDGVAAHFDEHEIDCLKIVPSHLASLLTSSRPEKVLPRKLLVLGGEASSWELVGRIRALAPSLRIMNHYGPTETTVGVMTFDVADAPGARSVPIGRPLPGMRAYVLDRAKRPVPTGVRGELYVAGPQVARGYVGAAEATGERFLPDAFAPEERMYRTGDVVRRLPSGDVEFLGRVDHQLKVRGFRVEPGEIEATLATHPAVRASVVAGHADGVVAYVVAEGADGPKAEDLRAFLRARLPEHMVPSWVVHLDALPLGPNGKIDRKSLPPPGARAHAGAAVAPRTETEALVAAAWKEALGIDGDVDVRATFAELGGHSLAMVRVHARLKELVPSAPPLAALFDQPTIEALAADLDERRSSQAAVAPPPRPVDAREHGPRLVELRAGRSDRAPLLLVHQAGGVESSYFELAAKLDADQPVYAVRADFAGLDPCVERLAARYLELVRARARRGPYAGPYVLGGASFGGLVAYEMAQQLRHQREPVAPVFLIDTEEPGRTEHAPRTHDEIRAFLRAMAPDLVDLLDVPCASRPEGARELFPEAHEFLGNFRDCVELRAGYAPRAYAGDVVFFRASERVASGSAEPEKGWSPLVRGRFTVIDVPGNHMTMLRNPHVAALATHISEHIARGAPR